MALDPYHTPGKNTRVGIPARSNAARMDGKIADDQIITGK